MSLSQQDANRLLDLLKHSVRAGNFDWQPERQDEEFVAESDNGIMFVLTLTRNPFEIKLHFRTKDQNIGLCRIDNHRYHGNPDGTELRDQPHMHVYREGYDLAYAEAIDWYDVTDPVATLNRFLNEIHARFQGDIQRIFFS